MHYTSDGKDLSFEVEVPMIITGQRPSPGECEAPGAPWGAPDALPAAKELLTRAAALLDLLERAQREGQLAEAGLCELERLQRFYSALKRQVDGKPA